MIPDLELSHYMFLALLRPPTLFFMKQLLMFTQCLCSMHPLPVLAQLLQPLPERSWSWPVSVC